MSVSSRVIRAESSLSIRCIRSPSRFSMSAIRPWMLAVV